MDTNQSVNFLMSFNVCLTIPYNKRYHESLHNVTPADTYFGRDKSIIREKNKINRNTINQRRLQHFRKAA